MTARDESCYEELEIEIVDGARGGGNLGDCSPEKCSMHDSVVGIGESTRNGQRGEARVRCLRGNLGNSGNLTSRQNPAGKFLLFSPRPGCAACVLTEGGDFG